MLGTISDMQDSMVVNISYHANDPSSGMALHRDTDRYKMFVGAIRTSMRQTKL